MSSQADDMVIDIRRLRYFIAVCEHGGFSKASSAIGIAQPALTRQIKLLERDVGLPLVARSGRGAEPTEEGKFLLARSAEHIAGLENAVREVRQRFSNIDGHVALGMCPTIAPFFRADLEAWTAAAAPKAVLSIIEAYSGDLHSLMENRRIDMALTYKPVRNGNAAMTELFSERLVVVSGYPSEHEAEALELRDLSSLKLILPSKIHELRRIIDRACQRHGFLLRPDIELDSLDAVKTLLMKRALHYCTILPARSVADDVAARLLSAQPIRSTEMMRTIVVMTAAAMPSVPIISMLHNKILELARNAGSFSDCIL